MTPVDIQSVITSVRGKSFPLLTNDFKLKRGECQYGSAKPVGSLTMSTTIVYKKLMGQCQRIRLGVPSTFDLRVAQTDIFEETGRVGAINLFDQSEPSLDEISNTYKIN